MAELRPGGVARTFGAVFMIVWLSGWAVGEAVALAALVVGAVSIFAPGLIPGAPTWAFGHGMVFGGIFLAVWLLFWTIGGVAAIRELLGLLWGVDRVGVDGGDLVLESKAGPLRRSRRWPRDDVRRIVVHRGTGSLAVETTTGTTPLTRWGDNGLRLALRERLRASLALDAGDADRAAADAATLPEGWEAEIEDDGTTRLVPRRATRTAQARVAWLFAAVLFAALVALFAGPPAGRVGLALVAVLALLAGAASTWLSFGGRFIRVRHGALEPGHHFRGREWGSRYESPELAIERHVDSDGDEHFRLIVFAGGRRATLISTMNDARPPIHLGHWLASRVGARFEPGAEALAAQ